MEEAQGMEQALGIIITAAVIIVLFVASILLKSRS